MSLVQEYPLFSFEDCVNDWEH